MAATRFTSQGERYLPDDHATVYTATLELGEGHTITREHTWADRFGPVPGSHHVAYTCTCGAYTLGQGPQGPRSSDLAELHHFADAAERTAFEQHEADHLARILRALGHE